MFRLGGIGTGAPPTQKEMEEAKKKEKIEVRKNILLFVSACLALKSVSFVYNQLMQ